MGIRVLIADADVELLELYRSHLSENGLDVRTATTALECLERLRDGWPALMVLEPNILWGGGDGVLEVMESEADVPSVPVIIVSSLPIRPLPARFSAAEIAEYHSKPVAPEQLLEAVLRARASGEPRASAASGEGCSL